MRPYWQKSHRSVKLTPIRVTLKPLGLVFLSFTSHPLSLSSPPFYVPGEPRGHLSRRLPTGKRASSECWASRLALRRQSWPDCSQLPLSLFLNTREFYSFSFLHLFLTNFYWSIFELQCCVSFCCISKWVSYTYIYSFYFPIQVVTKYWIEFCAF